MSDRKPTPYGLTSLLECMSRAALLEQPDDIPEFLSTHVEEMTRSRGGEEARDTKVVAFDYQEEWENAVLQRTETPLTSHEEPHSPLSSESITPSASFRVSLSPGKRQKMRRVSSVRLPAINNRVGLTYGEIPPPAALLERPEDIPEFLSTHVEEMTQSRGGEEARDTKEVAFDYQEEWENVVLQRTETPLTAPEEPLSPLSSEFIPPSASFRVSPPPGKRQKMRRVSSVRLPAINNRVGLTHGEISPPAAVLEQPDDIPEFLSTHVEEMTRSRGGEEARDTKEVAFDDQEEWEKIPLTAPEEPHSPLSNESITPSASFRVSPPPGKRQKMRRVSSVRLPAINNRVGLTYREISPPAALLEQPEDIPEFLSTHVEEMTRSRGGEEARDTKEVAFDYQEEWENAVLQKTDTPRMAPEEPSPLSSKSITPFVSFRVSPPPGERRKMRGVSSVRLPTINNRVGLTYGEISPPAALLEQPDDIPEFLSTRVEEMTRSRGGEEARDTKEVAFDYQEDWEKTPLTAPEEPHSPLSIESIPPSASFRVSPPPGERQNMRRVSSVRLPAINNRVGLTHGEISPPAQRRVAVPPSPPCKERDTTSQTKASPPSAVPVLPPIQQKAPSKQALGEKPTTGCDGRFACRMKDCCYHDKPKVGCAVDSELPPLRRPADLELKRLLAAPSKSDPTFPYRPKGGFVIDRELGPIRTRARPVTNTPCPTSRDGVDTNRTTGTESHLLCGGQYSAYSRQGAEVAHCEDMSLEYSVHTADSVHVIRYTYSHVQGVRLPPLSASPSNIASPPHLSKHQRVSRNVTPSDLLRRSSAMGRTPSSRQSSF